MSGIYEPLNEACRDRKELLMQEEDGEGGKEVEWNWKAEGGRKVRTTCLCLRLRERMWRACLLKYSIYVVDDVRKKQTDTSRLR